MVKVGRIATASVVLLGTLWIPVMKGSPTRSTSISKRPVLSGPAHRRCLFAWCLRPAHQWQGRADCHGVSFVVGILRIVLELFRHSLSGFLYAFATINFLYFCILLFIFSIVVMIVVSLLTRNRPVQLNGLTYGTTVAADKAQSRASWNSRTSCSRWPSSSSSCHLRLLLTTRDRGLSA